MEIVQEGVQEKAQEEITFNGIEEELLLALNCDFSEKNIFSQYITVEERENWVLWTNQRVHQLRSQRKKSFTPLLGKLK